MSKKIIWYSSNIESFVRNAMQQSPGGNDIIVFHKSAFVLKLFLKMNENRIFEILCAKQKQIEFLFNMSSVTIIFSHFI